MSFRSNLLPVLAFLSAAGCADLPLDEQEAAGLDDGKADSLSSAKPTGLGAIPYAGGTHFGVWAPNADRVWVAGDFNAWSATKNPMTRDATGNWSLNLSAAHPGHAYEFVIRHGSETLHKADPRARAMTNSAG